MLLLMYCRYRRYEKVVALFTQLEPAVASDVAREVRPELHDVGLAQLSDLFERSSEKEG